MISDKDLGVASKKDASALVRFSFKSDGVASDVESEIPGRDNISSTTSSLVCVSALQI